MMPRRALVVLLAALLLAASHPAAEAKRRWAIHGDSAPGAARGLVLTEGAIQAGGRALSGRGDATPTPSPSASSHATYVHWGGGGCARTRARQRDVCARLSNRVDRWEVRGGVVRRLDGHASGRLLQRHPRVAPYHARTPAARLRAHNRDATLRAATRGH